MAGRSGTSCARDVASPPGRELPEWRLFGNAGGLDLGVLREHLRAEGRLELRAALRLVRECRELLRREPNLLALVPPLHVVGDLHGQLYDLLAMTAAAGEPPATRFLFLGDYVDRGSFGVETCLYLLGMKVAQPASVWMLRGNHECRLVSEHFNFKCECDAKYGRGLWEAFMELFDCLPLAAEATSALGRFLFVHGGISPLLSRVEQLNEIDRFREPPEAGLFTDLLWSDPVSEETAFGLVGEELINWRGITYVDNSLQGCGCVFGLTALSTFLADNGLACVVRGHEVQKEGFHLHRFFVDEAERRVPLMVTVFSAPNYCDKYRNSGAIMVFGADSFDFRVYECVPHPYWLPRFENAFDVSLKAITRTLSGWVSEQLQEIRREDRNRAEVRQRRAGQVQAQAEGQPPLVSPRTRYMRSIEYSSVEEARGKKKLFRHESLDLIPQGIITSTITKMVPAVSLDHLQGVVSKARVLFMEKALREGGAAFLHTREDDQENERPSIDELRRIFEPR
eukprot:m51a1_g7869 putative calcineurin catalytic subunit (511) ;mRNA; f:327-3715